MAGIDTSAGLATSMGKTDLYMKMLRKFCSSQAQFEQQFQAALLDVDPKAAMRCAHTLKGTAGNIGARGVQEAAGALEQACLESADTSTIEMLLARTLVELNPVIEALQKLALPGATAGKAADTGSLEKFHSLLSQLHEKLELSDPTAADLVSELQSMESDAKRFEALSLVADAIDEFDFDVAAQLLSENLPTDTK